MMKTRTIRLATLLAWAAPSLLAAQAMPEGCPLHAQHMASQQHEHAGPTPVDERGDRVMGFGHDRTTHHFLLLADGGAIQVEANDPADAESLAAIRRHLADVAAAFAKGEFAMPHEIHDRVLPGVPEMTRRKDAIAYRYEEIPSGARVRITAADPQALAAVHNFLRAQIQDHRTGDPVEPAPAP